MGIAVEHLRKDHEQIYASLHMMKHIFINSGTYLLNHSNDIARCIRFLSVFAAMCHNGKEDIILKNYLEIDGIATDGDDLIGIIREHRLMDACLKRIQDSFPKNPFHYLPPRFIGSMVNYFALVKNHMEREEAVLFPMIDDMFSTMEQEALSTSFHEHEKSILEIKGNETVKSDIERMIGAFR